jgi:hypothetical protein
MTDKQLLEGGCHCGAVRYRASVDLKAGTTRCNCRICTMSGNWGAFLRPGEFTLTAGHDDLADYRQPGGTTSLHFCRKCGVRPFAHGDAPWMGGEYYSINLNCLDDQSLLGGLPVRWFDGRHDNWENTRDEVSPAPWP